MIFDCLKLYYPARLLLHSQEHILKKNLVMKVSLSALPNLGNHYPYLNIDSASI